MSLAFPGRVESKFTVDSDADVTLTPANYSSGQTVSLAAGSYFHTAAGSVSGGLATWQTALNAACSGYARTAASAATMLGYGDFTGGAAWSFDIASGNDTGLFGGVTMTASGSPVYGNTGPASAGDKAIGFDANTEYFSAGDVFDVTATDDLIVAWVGYHAAVPAATSALVSKRSAASTNRWFIWRDTSGKLWISVSDASNTFSASVTCPTASWYAGVAVLDRGTDTIRIVVCPLSGSPTLSSATDVSTLGDCSNASNLQVGAAAGGTVGDVDFKCAALWIGVGASAALDMSTNLSTAAQNLANAINSSYTVSLSSTDGRVTIANSFWDYSLTWTSTTLRDLLGFDADIASVQTATGAAQAKGVWLPDAPLTCDQHPSMVPVDTDARSSESPTGTVLTLTGNERYVHSNVGWMRVPVDRIRERSATYANASLEVFWRDCIVGLGDISWFSPGSDLQIWWNNQGTLTLLGDDGVDADGSSVDGWRPAALPRFAELAKPSQPNWVGQWDVRIPRLVSDG